MYLDDQSRIKRGQNKYYYPTKEEQEPWHVALMDDPYA